MMNKKINILLSSILGISLTFGIMEVPVLADSSVQAVSSYTTSDKSTDNNIVSKDNDIEQNGLKISIDKIVATKNKLQVTVKVESQKPLEETNGGDVQVLLTYGDGKDYNYEMSHESIDDKTMKIILEREVNGEGIPEKGNLRVDLLIPKYKINVGMDANVDFSESFKNTIEKDVSVNIPEFNFTVKKVESNALGTEVTYSKEEKRDSDEDQDIDFATPLILKIGDKMYRTMNEMDYPSEDDKGNTRTMIGSYNARVATYDKVKGQNTISIIPIVCSMTKEDRIKIYDDIYKNVDYKKDDVNKDTTNDISYTKEFDFSDGSKGEIYKIERSDNNLKVYCKGDTEKESLLMASTMCVYPKMEEGKTVHYDYESAKNMSFYRDPDDSLGYIVEFDNLEKDKKMELNFDYAIKEIDKYKIDDEIQL
ncbi:hypothetical protein [Clostridium saccharobutylicum]|uniref:DUF4179 domain-containing protein n=1 Tax=Clostridium saccharobutylicum TaxID=169679 RepID=A0A1S8NE69_CLOSA|nr:hypothetical protein [Clostridium saccharobutylicum]OOM14581.1 hypothetical protein CLOSAC_14610 [Clostridium saccharobutylicum]